MWCEEFEANGTWGWGDVMTVLLQRHWEVQIIWTKAKTYNKVKKGTNYSILAKKQQLTAYTQCMLNVQSVYIKLTASKITCGSSVWTCSIFDYKSSLLNEPAVHGHEPAMPWICICSQHQMTSILFVTLTPAHYRSQLSTRPDLNRVHKST